MELTRLGYTEMQIRTLGVWASDAMWDYARKDSMARDGLTNRLFGISGHESGERGTATGSATGMSHNDEYRHQTIRGL